MLSCSLYKKCNKKSWFDDFFSIFDRPDIIPTQTMTRGEVVNSVTRLVLMIFIFMNIFKYKYSLIFLSISFIIILILYFINTKENYSNMDRPTTYKNPLIAQNTKSNEKMRVQPIIVPRAHDKDVWSFPSYRHSAVNYNQSRYDLSEEFSSIPQVEDYKELDPRTASYTDFTLNHFEKMCQSRRSQNGEDGEDGEKNITPIENITTPLPSFITSPLTDSINLQAKARQQAIRSQTLPPQTTPVPTRPPTTFPTTTRPPLPSISEEDDKYCEEGFDCKPRMREKFYTNLKDIVEKRETPEMYGSFVNIKEQDEDEHFLPNQHLLIPKTVTSIYGPGAVTTKEKTQYLTNIQPTEYSYSDVTYPINSNLGISYTPAHPPVVLDQVATPIGTYPLFHSIDPQLIRDQNIPPERLQELPRRTQWSAKYSGFDAAPGTVNFEDIYDPRFNSYGDPYRSYGDVNLGQVQYYYGDVDAYRYPNFGIRSKVDFIDYTDPMGRVLPEYDRNVGVEDIKQTVHDQYNADTMYFREDLQERLMRKRNRELWQLRAMPLRKNANAGTFTSLY